MVQYFDVAVSNDDRRHLDVASQEAPLDIWKCEPSGTDREILLRVFQNGRRVDFDRVSYAIPVLSDRLAQELERIAAADIELIPALVDGEPSRWFVLNVLRKVDCIDRERSVIHYHPQRDSETPAKPRGVVKLVLDARRIGEHHVLRPKNWEIALVVSQAVKEAVEAAEITGLEFQPVTESQENS